MSLRRGWVVAWLAVGLAVPAAALGAGFDDPTPADPGQQFSASNPQRQDTPNDYAYDRAEPDDETEPPEGQVPSTNLFDERFDLFGFPSARTRLTATYKDGPNANKIAPGVTPQISGFNAAGAWKVLRGDPRVQVAILDTGINWNSSGVRTQVALNRGELPAPQPLDASAGLGGYDLNDNGALDVDDYKDDPRVGKPQPNGQDLIKTFSNGNDADGNGYVDDIAGWDFFDDDNDPADASSYFAAENHGTGRTTEAVERANDSAGELGVCPECQYVPLRIWDTFVSDQNSFAMGIVYAVDNGVEVIEGADGGLYHSEFAEKATQYAYDKGVAQLYSGDDLNTGNHNFPAYYDHTMLIEGTVADSEGLGMDLPSRPEDPGIRQALYDILSAAGVGTTVPVQTYFRGANTTQFGGKSSLSMMGPTGSTNTGKASGAAAIVIAAALQKGIKLTADETRELLEQTAEDVTPGNTVGTGVPDPAQPGFDTHFGYGRANVGEAVRAASNGNIPPEAAISSPVWYAPVTGNTVRIKGLARDRLRPGKELSWRLEWGIGLAPRTYTTVREGKSRGAVTDFGTLPLDEIRAALASRLTFEDRDDPGGPSLDKSPNATDPYEGQFSVRLRVTSGEEGVIVGEDRQVLTAIEDETLRPGFPKRLPAGGEAPLRYADLNGDNVQELVLPTEDGLVHAYRPDGSELKGWPVKTQVQFAARAHLKSPVFGVLAPPREPPRGPVVADLTGDGRPEVVTAAGERLYAWDATGKTLAGWPVNPDPERKLCAQDQQRKFSDGPTDAVEDDLEGHHPKCGFLASPSLARLEGPDKPPSIVIAGLDGRLRAYRPDGTPVPKFPVQLIDPELPQERKMIAESINNAAIGDLDGDGHDDVVVATNETYGGGGGSDDVGFGGLLSAAGQTSRVYAVSGKTGEYLPGWPIKLGGIIQNILPLIGPGHDAALVKVGGEQQIVVSTTSGPLATYGVDGKLRRDMQQNAAGTNPGGLNLFESAAVGDLDDAGEAEIVKYQIDVAQAANLLLVGQNFPYSHRIGAFDPTTGATKPGYPTITDDYQFLSSSTIAQVQPGATNQVIAGTGLGLLHAYDGRTGIDTPGFPKVTGGWLFAPAALSDDGRIAAVTREGFLFEWNAPEMPACQSEWPSFRHDPQQTGNYDADGTAPGAPSQLKLKPLGGDRFELSLRSPGDDRLCGTATRYVADVDGAALDLGDPVAGGEVVTREITLAKTARRITVRAADGPADGRFNLGAPGRIQRAAPGGPFEPVDPETPEPPPEETGPFPSDGTPTGPGGPLAPGPVAPTPGLPRPGVPVPLGVSAKQTAKLSVSRARVLRGSRRLDVLAPITRRASGRVRVAYRAAGRTIRFTARVQPSAGRIRFRQRIPRSQARKGTGILTIAYPGDADTRPQKVRLRAARNPARLRLGRPQVVNGRLVATGTIARRATGHVRVQMEYDVGPRTVTLERRARIRRGRWRLSEPLRTNVLADLGRRSGTVHSYTLFTGDEDRRIRGEMRSYEVAPAR